MKNAQQLWNIFLRWLSRKLRSPFSNFATKFVLFVGAGIVASPLIEHLIFSALMDKLLGIQLGIEVPDTEAYIFGTLLIFISLSHNLIFVRVNHKYQVELKDAETSVYKNLWSKLDSLYDDTARLINFYTTYYSEQEEEYTIQAEESLIDFADYLRKNRPFFFSESLYHECTEICGIANSEIQSFRYCMKAKIQEEKDIGKDADVLAQLEYSTKHYDYYTAQKYSNEEFYRMKAKYEKVCLDIRQHVGAI